MKSVECSAKTREEAIQNALSELGVEMYEVDRIEILDEGSKGIFGLGARPVRVSVSVDHLPDEPKRPTEEEERPPRKPRGRGGRGDNRQDRQDRQERQDRQGEARAKKGSGDGQNRGRGKKQGQDRGGRGDRQRGGNRQDWPRGAKAGGNGGGRGAQKAKEAPKEARPAEEPLDAESSRDRETFDSITDGQGKEASAVLQEVITKMGIEAVVSFDRGKDQSARLSVESEDGAILIGRKGRNLSAMQYLINRMVSRGDTAENTERLVVDVEGYVDRRRATLEDMAKSMAKRAKETGRNMRLKPLSPQERRIVHVALQDDPEVRTFSLGESLYRSVIISCKDGRQEGQRNSRGRGRGRGGRPPGRRNESKRRDDDDDIDVGSFGD